MNTTNGPPTNTTEERWGMRDTRDRWHTRSMQDLHYFGRRTMLE